MKKNIGIIISISMLVSLLFISAFVNATEETINSIAEVPIGAIIMFNGDEFEFNSDGYLINDTRFHICNGQNGTMNLRQKYVVGYDSDFNTIGQTLGNSSYNLTISQLPSHRHVYSDHTSLYSSFTFVAGLSSYGKLLSIVARNTDYTGSNSKIDNRPSSIVVNFIQRVI
jgi:hypothetical protein